MVSITKIKLHSVAQSYSQCVLHWLFKHRVTLCEHCETLCNYCKKNSLVLACPG